VGQLRLPAHLTWRSIFANWRRSTVRAYKTRILGDGDRIGADLEGGERHGVLRLFVVLSVLILYWITPHEEGASGDVAERWQDDFRAVEKRYVIAQARQAWGKAVGRRDMNRLWHGGAPLRLLA
jgi:hypothetical protein